jgi:integrase
VVLVGVEDLADGLPSAARGWRRRERSGLRRPIPRWRSHRGFPSGQQEILVFTDDKGNPIRQRWNEVWNRAAEAAALLSGTTPQHDLRHYYASLLIAKVPPSRLSR